METTVFILLTVISLGILLCAIAFSLKVIKKFIKYKASLLAAICVLILLIQCGAVIVIVNNFIHCIFMN